MNVKITVKLLQFFCFRFLEDPDKGWYDVFYKLQFFYIRFRDN